MEIDESEVLTHAEAAKCAGLSSELFRFYVKGGRGPESMLFKGRVFYRKSIVEKWKPILKKAGRPKDNGKS